MDQPLTLCALLERQCRERPAGLALVEGERQFSYADLAARARGAAAWLAAQGIGPGDRVAVWLVNRREWLAVLFGLASLGATLVAVNTRFRSAEIEYLLTRSKARLLVMQREFRGIDFGAILGGVDARKVPGRRPDGDPLRHLLYTGAVLAVVIAMGTVGYVLIEGWSAFDALYMTVTTVTTVGYHEVNPLSPAGRACTIILILTGVGTLFYVVATLPDLHWNRRTPVCVW